MLRRSVLHVILVLTLVVAFIAAPSIATADDPALPPGWGAVDPPPPPPPPPPPSDEPPPEDPAPEQSPSDEPAGEETPTDERRDGDADEPAIPLAWPGWSDLLAIDDPETVIEDSPVGDPFLAVIDDPDDILEDELNGDDLPTIEKFGWDPETADVCTRNVGDPAVIVAFPQPAEGVYFYDGFGAPRPPDRLHRGIDLMGEKGMPVVAMADGVVVRIRTANLSGHYVVIDHGNGWISYYMHMNNDTLGEDGTYTDDGLLPLEQAIAEGLAVGDEVVAGQLIGWVGDSGNAETTPPHTHFEIRKDGETVNPFPCLIDAWERQQRVWTLDGIVE